MRIQHNIMALNSYRQLGGNNSALSKNLEKLSSGYRINRAGDDAAGLAISEKMRAQIKGLEAAQKNANDGISLVQTAEGALTEVHSMLNRMVYLATQSANGTYDNEVDRANLDKEVQTLKEEIDRISKSTNFNGLNLLDGSMDASTTQTTGGKTDVPIIQEAATNPTQEVGSKTVLHKDADEEGVTEIFAELHNVSVRGKEGDSIEFTIGDKTVTLEVVAKGTAGDGQLDAETAYSGEELVDKIIEAFELTDELIGGQAFTATKASDNSIKFTQDNTPNDATEVVDANVEVKLEHKANPNGNPVDYTVSIGKDALGVGGKITIGGDELVIGEDKLAAATNLATAFAPDANGNAVFETESGYKVKYDATAQKLTITDPNGTLGKPSVKYDSYGAARKVNATTTAGTNAVTAAQATGATGEISLTGGDTISIAGVDVTLPGTVAAVTKTDLGNGYSYTIAAGTVDNTKWVITVDANAGEAKDCEAGNGDITVAGQTVTMAGGQSAATATGASQTFDLSGLKDGDKISVDGTDYIFDTDLATTFNGATPPGGTAFKFDGDKLIIESTTTGATSTAPTSVVKVSQQQVAKPEVGEPTDKDMMTGTWNVQSTKNKQGASANSGQLASTTFDLTTDMVKDGVSLNIGKEQYIFKVGKDSTVTAGAGQTLIDLSAFEEGDADLIDKAGALLANQANKAFTIGYAKGSGKISIHEIQDQKVFTEGELESVEEFDKLVYMTAPEKTETTGRGLTLQVGDTADDFQKVELNIKDMSTEGLGIADITIGTIDDATAAIAKIKEAINTVSAQRGDLGAVQNRLEHTINNLGVQAENITAAESRIRDTDMAEEMMAYTKNNILVQAAQAMLAQANQVPQGILQLLQ